jgi:ribosome-associated protein
MDIRKLQRVIVDGLEDVKAQNIAVFNTEHLSALFERVIIASGTSNRQTKSLASSVREAVKTAGYPVPRLEGERNGEWIIVDCGAAVVHVMQPTIRDYYHLEEIWGDKPVNMKLATGTSKLVKAEVLAPTKRPSAKTTGGKTAAPSKASSVKAPAKSPARAPAKAPTKAPTRAPVTTTAKRTATRSVDGASSTSRRAPAKKVTTAPRGGVVTRVVGVKTAAPKKSVARPAVKSPPAAAPRKAAAAPAKTSAVRKPAAKKAPARKSTVRT